MRHRPKGGPSATGRGGSTGSTARLARIRELPLCEASQHELLAATGDISIEIVREALRRLRRLGEPGDAQVLRWRIWRADPALVDDFAACIAAIGDQDAVEEALAIFRSRGRSYSERVAALALLGAFADSTTIPAVRSALDDPIAAVRQAALRVLRRFPADAATQHAVAGCLTDNDAQVRATAVESVNALCHHAGSLLQGLVGDESILVRAAVARSGAQLGQEPTSRLLADKEVRVRELAAQHAGTRAILSLARAARLDHAQPVRQAATRRLGELRAVEATGQLIDALADRDSLVRVTALRSLQLIHGGNLPGVLLGAIRDGTCQDCAALVYALGRLGASDELAALNDDPDVQIQAALTFAQRELRQAPPAALPAGRIQPHEKERAR